MNKLDRYEVKVLMEEKWIVVDTFPGNDEGHTKAKELLATLTDRIKKKIEFIYQ